MNRTTKSLSFLIAAAALTASGGVAAGQEASISPAPPAGDVWVYPTGVFPDDFHALWLAVNGAPYASGDLPFPFPGAPDSDPGTRPVFTGDPPPSGVWTVVLKARRLDKAEGGGYVEGPFSAFNLGLAAGMQFTGGDPVPPVNYLLTTGKERFSTGFGEVLLQRPVNIVGEMTPDGGQQFFGYTPNFDPAANPDTNPAFEADWLPADYPRGSEYEPGIGYGVRSTKSVIYGGYQAFHVFYVNVDLSVSDCLLYGQYGSSIVNANGPNDLSVRNVDIRHTYHCHQSGAKNDVGMFTWAINIQNVLGSGGKRLIDGCSIDQAPTWQEHYFGTNPRQRRYDIEPMPGGHGVTIYEQSKASPDDFVHIEDCTITNCGSNCIVFQTSEVDMRIANCRVDGGYFPITPTKDSTFADWRGNCIVVLWPMVDASGTSPVIEIVHNRLYARGLDAWGARLHGCPNGEVTVADNAIVCESAYPGYTGGVELASFWARQTSGNRVLRNSIRGTGGWAISVNTAYIPCIGNLFIDNGLAHFTAQEAGAVFFGPQANYNFLSGDVGAGVIDLGTGNVVE